MKSFGPLLVAFALALEACSANAPSTIPSGQSADAARAGQLGAASVAPERRHGKWGRIVFHLTVPRKHRRGGSANPHFVAPSSQSVTITLNKVNGGAPPAGVALSTNSALTSCSSGCSVVGPYAPPGQDNFTVTLFEGPVGTPGNALATASKTLTLAAGIANAPSMTLQGIPAKFALHGAMPSATANTALAATALPIDVEDAAGDVITGTYSKAVTIADPDANSLTACGGLCGSALQLGSGAAAGSVILTGDTDAATVKISYGGIDEAPVALTASDASGALTADGSVTFSSSIQPIVYAGSLNGSSAPEIDLYAPTGTGSTGAFTDSQAGWTNSPYDMTIGEGDNCATVAAYTQTTGTNGTAWTATVPGSPIAGTCTATLTGGAAATLAVTTTYTTGSIGVNITHRGRFVGTVKPGSH